MLPTAPPDPLAAYRPEPGPTGIRVDAQYYRPWPLAFAYGSTGPRILVNGNEIPDTSWGETHIPAQPGRYTVEVRTRRPAAWVRWTINRVWWEDMGQAVVEVPVHPGAQTPVYYRSPGLQYYQGVIGAEPKRWPALNWMRFSWVIVALFAAMIVAGVVVYLGR
ncbi:hypothetical protein [Nocardia lijiangensis]|uniref:hypothetical protein n=1 Tax=Nocardia lijiangensis TaxID=299618 RepID=UPI0008299583|nr:hypothetical protein [Nocardia lijiangensis]